MFNLVFLKAPRLFISSFSSFYGNISGIGDTILVHHPISTFLIALIMIKSHLYTRLSATPVFDAPADSGRPIIFLGPYNWVGVILQTEEWIRVLTARGVGWVKAEHLETRPHLQLHACWSEGEPMSYVSSPVSQ
jgi:hypothetical protein